MTGQALCTRYVMHGVVVTAILAFGAGGCDPPVNKMPRLMPGKLAALPTRAAAGNQAKGLQYRSEAGQAIAPMNIGDDPVAVAAPTLAPGAPRATLNGDPNGLTRESLNHAIQGSMGSLAACFTNITSEPMVAVSFEADPSGRASLVRVNGAPPDAERCIRNVVQGMRFSGFEGKGVHVDLPLSFHRAPGPSQARQSAEPQGPGAPPPLFLEP
jgi:hypothetical protein